MEDIHHGVPGHHALSHVMEVSGQPTELATVLLQGIRGKTALNLDLDPAQRLKAAIQ